MVTDFDSECILFALCCGGEANVLMHHNVIYPLFHNTNIFHHRISTDLDKWCITDNKYAIGNQLELPLLNTQQFRGEIILKS